MKKYRCKICGFIYDDAKEKIKFEDLPEDWTCPLCGAPKQMFEEIIEETKAIPKEEQNLENNIDDLRALSNYEKAFICSNLAKACEKEYKDEEKQLFLNLAKNFLHTEKEVESDWKSLESKIQKDIIVFDEAMKVADECGDRGAKRIITWASKTANVMKMLIETYEKKGLDYIVKSKIWVCDICGFVYIGDEPPKVCPICKVPSLKILEVI